MKASNFEKEFGMSPKKYNKTIKKAGKAAMRAGVRGAAKSGVVGAYGEPYAATQKIWKKAFKK